MARQFSQARPSRQPNDLQIENVVYRYDDDTQAACIAPYRRLFGAPRRLIMRGPMPRQS